ncbi:DET1- and DDB1-associated protein 1 [Trichonephila inaurata madagascariensis]|uniref:DET1- and DDB1-associated protein 1 n=1 Tax=Trichonephila inaurata madagascariensis TaxID=2747483 RepID=A0A8X6XV47_9ARAC|nr:DET1- and DDB1-associated protein 1 [Trichonephila inaurata madagascariensis]
MAGTEKFCKVKMNSPSVSVPYSQLLDLRSSQNLSLRASSETTAEFLKGLPSHNESNFSRYQPDASCKASMKKTSVYVPTKDHPSEQIITTEKTTILLRYLQQQLILENRKTFNYKRDVERAGPSGLYEHIPRKRSRVDDD